MVSTPFQSGYCGNRNVDQAHRIERASSVGTGGSEEGRCLANHRSLRRVCKDLRFSARYVVQCGPRSQELNGHTTYQRPKEPERMPHFLFPSLPQLWLFRT